MKRLSIDALKERSEQVQNDALLAKISGGTENDCHDEGTSIWEVISDVLSKRIPR